MEITYTMIGADGLQYGPITLEQLKAWVAEGRVTGDTKILRSDTNAWLPAANYTELGLAQDIAAAPVAAPPVATPPPAASAKFDPISVRRFYNGARWFYWIAALSLVNTVLEMSHTGIVFVVGLGITQIFQDNLVVSFAISGLFALLGFFATKGQSWGFIVGMILYTGDALIFLKLEMWLGLAFHVYVLFWLFMGVQSLIKLKSSAR